MYDAKGNCIYDGYVRNNQRSGIGTSFYSNGSKEYDGEWSFDLKSGSGTLYDVNGNIIYSGGWLNGHMAGRGELRTPEGVYVGSFANDKKNGRGIMRYNDGREEKQEWYLGERVADAGLLKAINNLYVSFDEAFLKDNYSVILSLANNGNADAQFFVGKCYDRGVVVKEDKSTAKQWYTKASSQGNSCATHNIGSLLEGQSHTDDAIVYFEKALQQGEMLAAWNLGRIYRLRWKTDNDINLFLVADAYLSKGLDLKKPNRYTTEKMFLKYKYECASMAHRNAKVVVAYYEKKNKFTFKKPNEFTEKIADFTAKMKRYDDEMRLTSSQMLSKYGLDITKVEW